MGGTPLDFEFLIGQLDRKRFQAWVMQYPSALRLETVADYLMLSLQDLRDGLGLDQVVVVAHSMGGLVSRAALNDLADTDDSDLVPLFVTISTPWSGHAAAASGVERSPVVLPVWRDMKPGSAFLQTLLVTPLPEGMEFQLFFGFEGNRSFRSRGGANDGVVTLASQLAPEAQQQARRLQGFPANHTEILRRDEVADALNALLVQSRERW
jgi:pimeloyl-ACP methyl ester carboxylesterase